MRISQRIVFALLATVLLPGAASAQTDDRIQRWAEEIAARVERQSSRIAAQIERQADQIARRIEQRLEAQGRRGRGAARGPEYTEPFSRTVRLGRNGMVDLENISGDIVVTGGGGDDVKIEATKRVRHPSESEARALLSEMRIDVRERSGRVDVRTEYPRRRNTSGSVDFTITVPRDAGVTLRSISGDMRVTTVNGELRVESVSGDIIATGARRIRTAKTVSGNLEINDGEADELTAGSISGNVTVNRLKAAGLDVQTVSSEIRLTDVEVDHSSLRSVSGDIDYVGRLSRNGRYQFQSHSGDVRITSTDSRGFTIDATTFSGDVRSDFPLTLQSTPGNGFGPRRGNRAIRGSFGDASATVTLQSFSGDIVLVKR